MTENLHNSLDFFYAERLGIARDALTQVLDRQTMVEYMEWLIEKGIPFSFFFIDIDNFKLVNDRHGHMTGDVVLAAVARYLEQKCYGKGVVGRYGGDEFMLILRDITAYVEIEKIASDINTGLTKLEIDGVQGLTLTLSAGISRFPVDAVNYNGIVGLADKVLYRAKMKGRNGFIIYEAEKHSNITMGEATDAKLSSMQLCSRVFGHITAYGEDIAVGISNLFRRFVTYYLFEHVCIQDRERMNFETVCCGEEKRRYSYIPRSLISGYVNKFGYASITSTAPLKGEAQKALREELRRQEIKSTFICEIAAYDKKYGYLRVDTVKALRVWQEQEMSLLVAAANTIGLILYYQKKKLEQLPLYGRVVVEDNR